MNNTGKRNKKLTIPEQIAARLASEAYDLNRDAERVLSKLEDDVKRGLCSTGFALARSFQMGAAYQTALDKLNLATQANDKGNT